MVIWVGIVDEAIIRSHIVDKKLNLIDVNYSLFRQSFLDRNKPTVTHQQNEMNLLIRLYGSSHASNVIREVIE